MKIHFYKFQATGNDFVIIDNRSGRYNLTIDQVRKICDRRFGVGADGLMLIEKHPTLDFNLVYYNSDGSQSLCGNGSRAAVIMAASLGMVKNKTTFNAYDGPHEAELLPDGEVKLKMADVRSVDKLDDALLINTGSPHFIRFVDDVSKYPVFDEGKLIRYSERFKPAGTNVNFVQSERDNTIFVRTYERGVENETLSCGTGVTAAALAANTKGYASPVKIKTLGGSLKVAFNTRPPAHNGHSAPANHANSPETGMFTDIFLIGPAKMVFEGDLEL